MELGLDLVARDATAAVFSDAGSGVGFSGGACENIDWTVDVAVAAAALRVGAAALRQPAECAFASVRSGVEARRDCIVLIWVPYSRMSSAGSEGLRATYT
jgi:hypothetical protein